MIPLQNVWKPDKRSLKELTPPADQNVSNRFTLTATHWDPYTFPRNQDVLTSWLMGRVTVTNPCEVFRNFRLISLINVTCETTIKMLRMNANLVSAARARHSEVSDACSLSSVWSSTSCVRFPLSTNDQLKAAPRHRQHGLATSPTVVTLKKIRPSRQDQEKDSCHWKEEITQAWNRTVAGMFTGAWIVDIILSHTVLVSVPVYH